MISRNPDFWGFYVALHVKSLLTAALNLSPDESKEPNNVDGLCERHAVRLFAIMLFTVYMTVLFIISGVYPRSHWLVT